MKTANGGTAQAARHAALALLFAACAFSYALATSAPGKPNAKQSRATPRVAATSLRFSNPFLLPGADAQCPAGGQTASDPQGFDLGDAAYGSQIVRYVNALGGYQPYNFFADNIGSNGSPGLGMNLAGRVSGVVAAGGPAAAAFLADVVDAAGDFRSGYFRVTMVNAPASEFRFAMDRVPTAQVGVDYITNLETIGGNPDTRVFTAVTGSIVLNGRSLVSLEDAGLALYRDGVLAGRPLESGTLSFTARATSGGAVARDRTNQQPDQPLRITIESESAVQSALATSKALMRGDSLRPERGQFTLKALFNPDGYGWQDFAGFPFVLRLGDATFATVLDSSGRVRTGNLRVKLDAARGMLTVTLRNTDMAAFFPPGTLIQGGSRTLVATIEAGATFRAVEPLALFVKRARGTAFQLDYRLGRDRQLAGLFQVTSLKAAEFIEGTAFRTKFVMSPVRGYTDLLFGYGERATVYIGPAFVQTVDLRDGKGRFPPSGVRILSVNPLTRSGVLETYPLLESETGIKRPSESAGTMQTLLLSIDLTTNTTFMAGDASRRIFPVLLR